MHTLSIKIDDSIYEHSKGFLKFYPSSKLSIIENDDDVVFSASDKSNYAKDKKLFEKKELEKWERGASLASQDKDYTQLLKELGNV
jgi:hypothetical protein